MLAPIVLHVNKSTLSESLPGPGFHGRCAGDAAVSAVLLVAGPWADPSLGTNGLWGVFLGRWLQWFVPGTAWQ